MSSKPLSKAQQRVMDWLAESPDNYAEWSGALCSFRLHCDGAGSVLQTYQPQTIEALVNKHAIVKCGEIGLFSWRIEDYRVRYIHPKFAGGTDDQAN